MVKSRAVRRNQQGVTLAMAPLWGCLFSCAARHCTMDMITSKHSVDSTTFADHLVGSHNAKTLTGNQIETRDVT